MTPQQFLAGLKQGEPAPVYLFVGPEPYQLEFCRNALIARVLGEARESGLARHDLEETTLAAVLDDACSLSLFSTRRVIVVSNAEAALPQSKTGAQQDEDQAQALAEYVRNPVEGVVLVFEAARYEFQGDDKRKLERVQKFYAAAPAVVEFPPMSDQQARKFAENLARKAGLEIGPAELDLLVEALGGKAANIATEIEKLQVYAASGRTIGAAEIAALVPEAREATIFALVAALGRNDRVAALGVLDTLIRQGEYLPLALSFLGTQFRLALAAKEAKLKTAQQISDHFSRLGMQMWRSRAEQVSQTVASFPAGKLAAALEAISAADRALRDARPDDRLVMEQFILRLTG